MSQAAPGVRWAVVALAVLTIASAPAGRYVTVDAQTLQDTQTNLLWAFSALPPSTQSLAISSCAAVTRSGGGWRLPTVLELSTLVDERVPYPPALDTSAFILGASPLVWTVSAAGGGGPVWVVDFTNGSTRAVDPAISASTLCVHDP